MMEFILIVVIIAIFVVLDVYKTISWGKERQKLLDRIQSRDIIEYKRVCEPVKKVQVKDNREEVIEI